MEVPRKVTTLHITPEPDCRSHELRDGESNYSNSSAGGDIKPAVGESATTVCEADQRTGDRSHGDMNRWGVVAGCAIAGLVSLVISLCFLQLRGALNGHEVLVGQTAREMVRSGNWTVPRFAGHLRFQKPPLAYWLTGSVYLIAGVESPWTARLPSALSCVACACLVSWYLGCRAGPAVGVLAGLIQATSAWSIMFGKSALVDMTLTLVVTVAVLAPSLDRVAVGIRWSYVVVTFWICCGLAVLAKGPVGLAIIWPTVLLYRLLRDRQPTDRPILFHRASVAGLCLFGILSLGWPLTVVQNHPQTVALWLDQSLGRYLQHWKNDPPPWYYYLYYTPLLTLPWTPFWLVEMGRSIWSWRIRRLDDRRLLCLLWFLVSLILFSSSAGKRSHYILPALPALSLLAAPGLVAWGNWCRAVMAKYWIAAAWIGCSVIAGLGIATVAVLPAEIAVLRPAAWVYVTVAVVLAASALRWSAFPESRGTAAIFWTAVIVAILNYEANVASRFDGRPGVAALVARNRPMLDECDLVVQYGSNDHSTAFLIDRPMEWIGRGEEISLPLAESRRPLIMVPKEQVEELLQKVPGSVLDMSGPQLSLGEQKRGRQFVLVQPHPAFLAELKAHSGSLH